MVQERTTSDGTEPIADEELIFRRVPVRPGWYANGSLDARAFRPREDGETGISVSRGKYKSVADAARGMSPQGYFVVVFLAGKLRSHGVQIEPRPLPGDPGHAEIVSLTYQNAKSASSIELMDLIATLYERVEGPFYQETAG